MTEIKWYKKPLAKKLITLAATLWIGLSVHDFINMPVTPSIIELIPCAVLSISAQIFIDEIKIPIYELTIHGINQPELKAYWWYVTKVPMYHSKMFYPDIRQALSDPVGYTRYCKQAIQEAEYALNIIALNYDPHLQRTGVIFGDILEPYIAEKPNIFCTEKLKLDYIQCFHKSYDINYLYRMDRQENKRLMSYYKFYLQSSTPKTRVQDDDLVMLQSVLANLISYDINANKFTCKSRYYQDYKRVQQQLMKKSDDSFLAMMTVLGYPGKFTEYVNKLCKTNTN